MKILISDYIDSMMPDHELETQTLKEGLGEDIEIEVYAYTDENREEFYEHLKDADALLTAFTKIDKEAMEHAVKLAVPLDVSTGVGSDWQLAAH